MDKTDNEEKLNGAGDSNQSRPETPKYVPDYGIGSRRASQTHPIYMYQKCEQPVRETKGSKNLTSKPAADKQSAPKASQGRPTEPLPYTGQCRNCCCDARPLSDEVRTTKCCCGNFSCFLCSRVAQDQGGDKCDGKAKNVRRPEDQYCPPRNESSAYSSQSCCLQGFSPIGPNRLETGTSTESRSTPMSRSMWKRPWGHSMSEEVQSHQSNAGLKRLRGLNCHCQPSGHLMSPDRSQTRSFLSDYSQSNSAKCCAPNSCDHCRGQNGRSQSGNRDDSKFCTHINEKYYHVPASHRDNANPNWCNTHNRRNSFDTAPKTDVPNPQKKVAPKRETSEDQAHSRQSGAGSKNCRPGFFWCSQSSDGSRTSWSK